jgi:hypothetical protein
MVKIPKNKENKKLQKRSLKEKRRDKKNKKINNLEKAKQEERTIFRKAS